METGNQILEALLNFWTLLIFFNIFQLSQGHCQGPNHPPGQLFKWFMTPPGPDDDRMLRLGAWKSTWWKVQRCLIPPILQTFFKLIVIIGRRCKWHWHPVQVGSRKGLFCWIWKSSMRLSPLLFACLHRACKWSCRDLAERQTQATGWLQRLHRCPIGDLHSANSFVFDLKDVLYSYIRDMIFVEIRPSSFTSQRLEICAKIARTWFFSPPQSDFNLAWTRRKVATRTGQKLQYKRRGGMQTLVWQDFPNLRAGTTGSGAHVQLCATISSAYPIHPANGPGAQGHFHWEAFKTTERWKECKEASDCGGSNAASGVNFGALCPLVIGGSSNFSIGATGGLQLTHSDFTSSLCGVMQLN